MELFHNIPSFSSPKQVGMVERYNQTLKNMIRSVIPLKRPYAFLSRVPGKFIPKTPFKLWTKIKPSIN